MLSNLIYSIFGELDSTTLLIKLGIALLIFVGFKILSILFVKHNSYAIKKLFKIKNEDFERAFSESVAKPFSLFLTVVGGYLALVYIPFAPNVALWAYPLITKLFRVCLILVVSISAQNFVGHITVFVKWLSESKNITVIAFFTKLAKALIIVLTAVILFKEFGYDINGLIAGLGLGGLTFALAAQDTASNFFSGLVILFDKPFAIGDWIAVGAIEGVVEEMNFRSCRVRTFDNALISVPNSKLSSDSVTNWTKMNLRKTKFTVGLVYSTNKDTLQKVCYDITTNLNSYAEIKQDTIMVWFDKFNTSSLDVTIQYHSYPIPLAEHIALKQKVYYMVMDIIHSNDTDFAFETRTIIQKSDL
ncbi:MAG: mechanosensitive ion channel family protein [Oscillospiraceae bacterium]